MMSHHLHRHHDAQMISASWHEAASGGLYEARSAALSAALVTMQMMTTISKGIVLDDKLSSKTIPFEIVRVRPVVIILL